MKNEPKTRTLKTAELGESPWNVHAKKDEDLRGLADSIQANGLVQPIAVRMTSKGWEVVDGHRRLAAAKMANVESVPCVVLAMTDAEAQAATLAANVQRIENDPLLEAELIERMRDGGQTYKAIAAALGKTEYFVARRARLIALAECWRKAFAEIGGEEVPAWFMERVAAHESDLQESVFARWAGSVRDFSEYEFEQSDIDEIDEYFDDAMCELDPEKVPFDLKECGRCECNTATHGVLFPDLADTCPRCQDAACYAKRWNGATDAEIEKLRKSGETIVEVQDRWRIPDSWSSTPRKERKNTQAYLYTDGGMKHIVWSIPKPKPGGDKPAKTEAEKAAEKAEKKAAKLVRSAREKMRAELRRRADAGWFDGRPALDILAERYIMRALKRGWYEDELVDDFAAACSDAVYCLDGDEAEAYKGAMEKKAKAEAEAEEGEE